MPPFQTSEIDTWIFDLDNTLYPPEVRLFDQIEVRMTAWVATELGVNQDEANRIRRDYWLRYGTTLAGLMREHDVDPGPYLTDVHDISMANIAPDPALADAIGALPGRRIVYTNGCEPYARRVIEARGLSGQFHAVYGVEHAGYLPKPEREAYDAIIGLDGFHPARAAFFEDDARNLREPHGLGMRTIHVSPDTSDEPFIHHRTTDLAGFLTSLLA